MLHRRVLFWAVAAAAAAAFAARRSGALSPARDPAWARVRGSAVIEGRLAGPVRRSRAGWRTLLEFPSATGPQRAQLWLPTGADPTAFEPGRAAVVRGRLRPPRRPRDPGDDDEEARATAAGAAWVLRAEAASVSTETASAAWLPADWA
jgi:hypothetical protein